MDIKNLKEQVIEDLKNKVCSIFDVENYTEFSMEAKCSNPCTVKNSRLLTFPISLFLDKTCEYSKLYQSHYVIFDKLSYQRSREANTNEKDFIYISQRNFLTSFKSRSLETLMRMNMCIKTFDEINENIKELCNNITHLYTEGVVVKIPKFGKDCYYRIAKQPSVGLQRFTLYYHKLITNPLDRSFGDYDTRYTQQYNFNIDAAQNGEIIIPTTEDVNKYLNNLLERSISMLKSTIETDNNNITKLQRKIEETERSIQRLENKKF